MKLKLTFSFIAAFLPLLFIMHEAHELVHTVVGRLICGCWGTRDFNVWQLGRGCTEREPLFVLATFAGPAFTFFMAGYGAYLMGTQKSDAQNTMGLALVFANKPFAHIFTAALGKGDTVSGFNLIWHHYTLAWTAGFIVMIALSMIPLVKAWSLIENKSKTAWFALFFLAPTFIDGLVTMGIMNKLLAKGFFSEYWILGSPKLVIIWMLSLTGIFLIFRKNIYLLNSNNIKNKG